MKRLARLLVVVGIVCAWGAPGAAVEGDGSLSWLAAGDSFSSGEGIEGADPTSGPGGRDCQRATGDGIEATAWAVTAFRGVAAQHSRLRSQAFVACTGAVTDDWRGQFDEASAATGRQRWDLVSFSFGGNNVHFEEVIYDCLGFDDLPWGDPSFQLGCDVTLADLERRADMLAGQREPVAGEFDGLTMPALLDEVAEQVADGGDVLVVGYPNLIEEPDNWEPWRRAYIRRCAGIREHDVEMLREATAYLNQQIQAVVREANSTAPRGITYHFVDLATKVYERGDDAASRHGLCSADPWITHWSEALVSMTPRKQRSFHPNQAGHDATGLYLAAFVNEEVEWPSDPSAAPDLAGWTMGEVTAFNPATGLLQVDLGRYYTDPCGELATGNGGCRSLRERLASDRELWTELLCEPDDRYYDGSTPLADCYTIAQDQQFDVTDPQRTLRLTDDAVIVVLDPNGCCATVSGDRTDLVRGLAEVRFGNRYHLRINADGYVTEIRFQFFS